MIESKAQLHTDQYLKLPQVLQIVPVSRSTWYRGVASGIYPKPVKLSERSIAWRAAEVLRAIETLQEISDETGPAFPTAKPSPKPKNT